MPSQRGRGQTLVAFPLDEALLAALDKARGPQSRSGLVRKALFDFLRAKGYQLDESIIAPPDRAGKGGRKLGAAEKAALNEGTEEAPAAKAPRKEVKYTKPPKKKAGGDHGS